MLPEQEKPAYTEGYEGFFHLDSMEGSVEEADRLYHRFDSKLPHRALRILDQLRMNIKLFLHVVVDILQRDFDRAPAVFGIQEICRSAEELLSPLKSTRARPRGA